LVAVPSAKEVFQDSLAILELTGADELGGLGQEIGKFVQPFASACGGCGIFSTSEKFA
jgi:hypothetical protein